MVTDPRDNVDWDVPPPTEEHLFIPVVKPWLNKPVTVVILSHKTERCTTHWDHINKRSLPHFEGPGVLCEGCQISNYKRWNGYLAGWSRALSRQVLVHLTAESVRFCSQLLDKTISLRGQTLKLQRLGDKPNGPVRAMLEGMTASMDDLPQPFDVRQQLLRLWGATTKERQERFYLTISDPDPEEIPCDFGLGGAS